MPFRALFGMPEAIPLKYIILLIWSALSLAYGYYSALQQVAHGDLYVFYISGQNFMEQHSLYSGKASGLTFMYPPFAAAVHQILALGSLKFASGLFSGLNMMALGCLLVFTRNWFEYRWNLNLKVWAFSWLITAFYFFLNLQLVQNNIFLLLLTFISLELWFREKFLMAGMVLSFVIFFKLTALFLAFWMVLRSGYKFILALVAGFGICLIFPVVFRGWDQSLTDWYEFYFYFFRYMMAGHVYTDLRNQNLAATLLRFLSEKDMRYPHADVLIADLNAHTIRLLLKWIQPISMLIISGAILMLRKQGKKIRLEEPALFLCLSHLYSGLTWNQHLVSLLLVSAIVISRILSGGRGKDYVWLFILILGSISFKKLIGTELHVYAYSVGLYTWILIFSSLFLLLSLFRADVKSESDI